MGIAVLYGDYYRSIRGKMCIAQGSKNGKLSSYGDIYLNTHKGKGRKKQETFVYSSQATKRNGNMCI